MKGRKKGKSEYEHLEAENKRLRKENQELQKEILRLKRKPKPERLDRSDEDFLDKKPPEEEKISCEKCNSHDMLISVIPSGTLMMCKKCKNRKVIR